MRIISIEEGISVIISNNEKMADTEYAVVFYKNTPMCA